MDDDFAKIFSETRHGKSLWKIFLILASIMFLIETLLGKPDLSKLKSRIILERINVKNEKALLVGVIRPNFRKRRNFRSFERVRASC